MPNRSNSNENPPQLPLLRIRENKWSRSDIIAGVALTFSAAALIIAYQAETRVRKAEWREVEAVSVVLGSKMRSIANSAKFTAAFMQGFLDHKDSNPKDFLQVDSYIIELASSPDFPELPVLPEYLTALTRTDSNVAGLVASCSDRRADIQIDFAKIAVAEPGKFTDTQLSTARIMPFRLRELGASCKASLDGLIALVPNLPRIMGAVHGTIGEAIEAEISQLENREDGISMTLHLGSSELGKKVDVIFESKQ